MSKSANEDCAFCEIARGEAKDVDVVGSGVDWVAFFPLNPATPGHTLVIPRSHISDFWEADAGVAASLAIASLHVGKAIEGALSPQGMNLITSAGAAAEQTVFHLHIHLVPRWPGDAIGRIWPPKREGRQPADRALADRIRRALHDLLTT